MRDLLKSSSTCYLCWLLLFQVTKKAAIISLITVEDSYHHHEPFSCSFNCLRDRVLPRRNTQIVLSYFKRGVLNRKVIKDHLPRDLAKNFSTLDSLQKGAP